jgi:hypothetical protein
MCECVPATGWGAWALGEAAARDGRLALGTVQLDWEAGTSERSAKAGLIMVQWGHTLGGQ